MKTFLFISFILIQTISLSFQSGPTVPNGKYLIINKENCDALDVEQASKECGANLIVYDKHGQANQQFFVCNIYGDYVTLTNVNSGLALTVENKKLGSKIEQTPVKGYPTAYQLFKFIEVCDGYYLIYNKASGYFINGNSCARTQFGYQAAIEAEKPCVGDIAHLLFSLCPVIAVPI